MDALALSRAIQSKQVSCVEVMNAYLDHIDALNPKVNAIVSLQDRGDLMCAGQGARRGTGARRGPRLDARLAAGDQGPDRNQGHPHHARLAHLQGFRARPPTPSMSSALKRAGAIIIGKTNTPEFGLGSNTYNDVFGRTLNSYDQSKTAGGSSGGAGVAVALHMLPVADGTDHGGSLRNPAAYNNVFGFRPSFGRVPANALGRVLRQHGRRRARWRATCPISRRCCRCRRATIRARRCRTGRIRRSSRRATQARLQGRAHRLGRRLRRPAAVRAGDARSLQGRR